jgi:hypothetical protein
MRINAVLAVFIFALAPGWATAAVADASANGFTVKVTLRVQAPPDDVYRRIIHNVGDWWNPSHTFSGSSRNLTIEERAMGCFCEKLPNHGAVRHMEVLYFAPGERLKLSGALGPLQSMAATGTMDIQLSAAEGATKLDVTYAVAGYLPAGMNTWAAPVDSVITEQFTRLKNYAERGDPAAK